MKILTLVLLATVVPAHHPQPKPREWTKTVQIPPCGEGQNMQVIWPKHFHGSVTIECDNLPTKRRGR